MIDLFFVLRSFNMNKEDKHNNRYKKKYMKLKRIAKTLIIENAALCDEVARIQESILIVKDERKFLLRKILEHDRDPKPVPNQPKNLQMHNNTLQNGPSSKTKKNCRPDIR